MNAYTPSEIAELMPWHGTEPERCEEPCNSYRHVRRCNAPAGHPSRWHDCAEDWYQRRVEACSQRGSHEWVVDDTQGYVYCAICLTPKEGAT